MIANSMQTYFSPKQSRAGLSSGERLCIEIANERAVVHGPLQGLQVTWLRNGNGCLRTSLPEELVSVGYHIMQPERMPDWLLAKLEGTKQ